MKRKVNMVGTGTLTISLPSKWVKNNGIMKGDDIDLIETGNELTLKTSFSGDRQTVAVDLSNVKSSTILNVVIVSLFRRGFKRIEVKFTPFITPSKLYSSNKVSTFLVIQQLVSYYIGVEIIEEKTGFCVLEEIIDVDSLSFEKSFNRALLLLSDLAKKSEKTEMQESIIMPQGTPAIARFYMIDKFFKYCLKILDHSNFTRDEIQRYTLLISNMSSIGYALSIFKIIKNKTAEDQKILEKIYDCLELFHSQCSNPSIKKLNDLAEELNNVQQKLFSSRSKSIFLLNIINILKFAILYLPLDKAVDVKIL